MTKLHVTHSADGAEIIRESDEVLAEELDFRAGEVHLSRAERMRLTAKMLDNPHAEDFRNFLRLGKDGIDESRAQTTVTTGGGYLVPDVFSDSFAASLKQHDQLFDIATRVVTERGGPFSFPVDDDTATNAAVVNENQGSATNVDVVFGNLAFPKCPNWRSGLIRVSRELVEDTSFDLGTLLAGLFGKRFSRGVGSAFITALLAAADVATTSASPSAVTIDEALDLMGSLDAAFAVNATWLMGFATYVSLLKLKASTAGSYLVRAEVDAEGYPLLLGRRVYLSPSMPTIGAGAKAVSFGDHTRFIRREVRRSLVMKTYVERYAEFGQVAYEAHWQVQGDLAKAANSPLPVRLLACHA